MVPSFNQCPSPKFIADDMINVDKYFLTEDLLAKFCPEETPKVFSYQVTENISLHVYLKGEWVYLRAIDGLRKVSIYAPHIRLAEFKNYTHVIPIDALSDKQLTVTINGSIEYSAAFEVIECTCVR